MGLSICGMPWRGPFNVCHIVGGPADQKETAMVRTLADAGIVLMLCTIIANKVVILIVAMLRCTPCIQALLLDAMLCVSMLQNTS